MIKLHEVHKVYTQGKIGYHALKNIDLYFEKGEFVSIFGPSGCGKTTLLNIMGGLDRPTSGEMVIDDRLTSDFVEKEWDYFRNHRIGFIFQQYNLIEHLPIVENVALSLKLGGNKSKVSIAKAKDILTKVGLENHIHKLPGELSGGERQRVAIARALINDPDIILADEPTGALDRKTGKEIMDLIKSVCADKLVIIVTHNRPLAEEYSSRIIDLKDGRVVSDSKPHDSKVKITKYRTKVRKKLSFKEAVKLSYYNIRKKFYRTLLVSLGLSVGIVGLILVDALFNSIRDGLAQQEAVISNNPDVYVYSPPSEDSNVTTEQQDLLDTDYFKELLYSPRNEYIIQYDVTNGALLSSPPTVEVIEVAKTDAVLETFTTLIGDSRLPENDNEITLNVAVAENLINSNVTLTNDELWDALKMNQYTIYDDFNYSPQYSSFKSKLEDGTCLVTGNWDGNVNNPPTDYNAAILGSISSNIDSLQEYRQSQIQVSETESLFCDSYDELTWTLDYSDPSNEGTVVTLVGLHENALFDEVIVSDNIVFSTSEDLRYLEEGYETNLYETSTRFRAFIKNDLLEDKTQILLDLESKGYIVQENFDNFNVFQGLTDLFMYVLQFIFSSIVAIAVITGGLMLLLILLISILERSREIGLIRAMGGTRNDISIIYTGETSIIGLLSGAFSVLFSIAAVFLLNMFLYNRYLDLILKHLPFIDPKHVLTINYPKLIWAILGSILIAIISGLIPAMKASRKKPIDALRNE